MNLFGYISLMSGLSRNSNEEVANINTSIQTSQHYYLPLQQSKLYTETSVLVNMMWVWHTAWEDVRNTGMSSRSQSQVENCWQIKSSVLSSMVCSSPRCAAHEPDTQTNQCTGVLATIKLLKKWMAPGCFSSAAPSYYTILYYSVVWLPVKLIKLLPASAVLGRCPQHLYLSLDLQHRKIHWLLK